MDLASKDVGSTERWHAQHKETIYRTMPPKLPTSEDWMCRLLTEPVLDYEGHTLTVGDDVLFILTGRFEEGICTKLHFESIEITSKFDESRTVIVPAESVLRRPPKNCLKIQ